MTTQSIVAPSASDSSNEGLARRAGPFVQLVEKERIFLALVATALIATGLVYPHAEIARWFGFALAGYSAVANDSVQTLGTFIASNRHRAWWLQWLFMGGIFLITASYSWYAYDGDVSYARLASKGFETTPSAFSYLQVAAPVVLLLLTRAGIPVSTTFLLLSCFATEVSSVGSIITKSFAGYAVAFGCALVVWFGVSKALKRWEESGPAHRGWTVAQWITSGLLWMTWLMQDAANVAVYLPRSLSWLELGAFLAVMFFGLGLLFKIGGERVQKVVDEKSRVVDVRAATVVDAVYAVILYVFKAHSTVPMSTTWVFVGLLAGREIAMAIQRTNVGGYRTAFRMAGKDLLYVTIGLVVSTALAFASNEAFMTGLLGD
ncbi:MAG: hypothetical protein R3B99_29550 [Polyangiales bacterium]